MDRFMGMQVFVAVAEEQGFAAGARRLNMSPPAVTRSIAALEDHLGTRLLHRTTRHVRVTEAGNRYLNDARRLLAELEMAEEAAIGIHAEPRGHLSVTAPMLFGRRFVMPVVSDYLKRYPEVEVSATLLDRVVNLLEEGMDVGIRIGELPDSSLQTLRVGQVRRVLCAAPDYLAQAGTPETPQDLIDHSIIASKAGSWDNQWRFPTPKGERTVQVQPRLSVTSNDAAIEAAEGALGITRLLSYQVAEQVAQGSLRIVLPEFEPPSLPIHVVHREGRHAATRVRTFIDLLAERLRADSYLNA